MPLPLAMMIPFMGIQSAVMAKQFGENFQYGKRRISAMSNDEFNKLTPKMIQDNANAELKAMIPSMQDSITDMRQFQEFMIKEMLFTIGQLLRNGLGFLLGITGEQVNTAIQDIEHYIHGHGGLAGHEEPIPQTDLEHDCPAGTKWDSITGTCRPTTVIETEPEPDVVNQTRAWYKVNAQGRIIERPGTKHPWVVQSNLQGSWSDIFGLAFLRITDAIDNALVTWTPDNYVQFGFTKPTEIYWTLKTKMPSSHNI